MTTSTHRLLVIIVNTRTPELVIDCLQSLAGEVGRVATEVLVVDNPCGDDSVDRINGFIESASFQKWCRVVRSDKNGGFGYGNNVGIQEVLQSQRTPQYIMLLNPDTIVRPGALQKLVEFMDSHSEVGICGSQLENADGSLAVSAHRMPTPFSEFVGSTRFGPLFRLFESRLVSLPIRTENFACDWVSGAALFARSKVFEEVGLLDDGFFVYFEEVELCWRAKKAGWEVWLVPNSRIVHLEGQSTGINQTRKRRPAYWYDSRRRFFAKCYGVGGLIAADVLWSVGRLSLMFRRLLRLGGGSSQEDPHWLAYDLICGDLKALIDGSVFRIKRNP